MDVCGDARPARAALALVSANALTEASQYFWPNGVFRGRFDPLDIVAYAVGIAACDVVDRPSTVVESPGRAFADP